MQRPADQRGNPDGEGVAGGVAGAGGGGADRATGSRIKLYTKSGDDGTTGLFSGARVGKDHPRIDAYGTVDELNASLGMVRSALGRTPFERRVDEVMALLQSRLFDLGADLATPPGGKNESRIARMTEEHVEEAERWIDEFDGGNLPLRTFVLPGGCEVAARCHVARTVCRRAERSMVALSRSESVGGAAIRYVNRVSDLMFALARRANRESGVPDVPWQPPPAPRG